MSTLQQIELQVLQVLGVIIASLVLWLLKRVLEWLHLKLSRDALAALNSAIDKMMTFGVTKAEDVIRTRGWDHVQSKNVVIGYAIQGLEDKFEETLNRSGIDLNVAEDRIKIEEAMERMWPDIATRLSASPATPPTVTTAVVTLPATS